MSADSVDVALTLGTGEPGRVVSWDGTVLVFQSPRAFAPGAPIKLALALADGPLDVELKAIGSRRAEGEPLFQVRARAMNLRREQRARLDAALRAG
jgi:hypothetical protein